MRYFILLYSIIITGGTLYAGNISYVDDLEYYGGIFRLALYEQRAPKLEKGMIDFYQLESYFRSMTSKEAIQIYKRYKKMRPRLYSDVAKILYKPISSVFDINYDINTIDNEKHNFFISSMGIELFLRIMSEYVLLDGRLDGRIFLDIYSIFDEKYLLEVSNYLKPILMEYMAAFLISHSFKKNEYREQILNRAMGILMFSYYPYELLDVDSEKMWQDFSLNPKHIIHRFGNIDYTFFHRIADLGVQTLTKLAYADTTLDERNVLNQFLLVEIFKEDEKLMQRTLDASRVFLRSDKLEEKIFLFS